MVFDGNNHEGGNGAVEHAPSKRRSARTDQPNKHFDPKGYRKKRRNLPPGLRRF
jgi:hypothetical protein